MRALLPSFILSLLVLLLAGPDIASPAHAGEDDPEQALRDARRRQGELEHRLQVALVRADVNQKRSEHLLRFVEDLLVRLADGSKPDETALRALRDLIDRQQADIAELQDGLRRERDRFVRTLDELRRASAKARAEARALQAQVLGAQHAKEVAEEGLRFQMQEVERLRWVYAREAPRESVAQVLSNIQASHWRDELLAGNATRARVALQVLGVLPDESAETIHAILHAARSDGSLLDAARNPLVRIGEPAVQPLVAAGCGEDGAKALDRGWVMHVLGRMGASAKGALPWLEEVAAGDGREAGQARHAIEEIRGE